MPYGKRTFGWVCAVAVAAALTATATGCAAQPSGKEPRSGAAGAATARPAPVRPLTWQQQLRISDAEERLTKQCMNRHGFSYWETRILTLEESRPVRYVQDDVEWARRYGYGSGIDMKADRARRHNPNAAYRGSLSAARRAAYDTALDGGDQARLLTAQLPGGRGEVRKRLGGCTAEAESKLYGDPVAWFHAAKIATNLRPLYVPELMRDKRLRTAVAAWSRCMRQHGYSYDDPQAAHDAVRQRTALSERSATAGEALKAERETAVADARCARETSLKSVGTACEKLYVGRLRKQYGSTVDTYWLLMRTAFKHAEELVQPRA
ncbi:hypothetical protein ACL02U_00475 [Streptomyces sp. MS06]|uniref:hypothetical protein n=1 Tax=Streptomyces sp. MS06 TaxID=3385974 RepID=UPI0039A17C2B